MMSGDSLHLFPLYVSRSTDAQLVRIAFVALVFCSSVLPSLAAELSDEARRGVQQQIDARAGEFTKIADKIWDLAEIGYQETRSSSLLMEQLKNAGFKITDKIGGLPTAFMAEYGSGQPVIAILGEYDALPGMQQDRAPFKRPEVATQPGHACGHNLFGTASALAAITVKEWLAEQNKNGNKHPARFASTAAQPKKGARARSSWSARALLKIATSSCIGILTQSIAPRTT